MVWIQIDDEVWEVYRLSWTLIADMYNADVEVAKRLEERLWKDSLDVLEHALKGIQKHMVHAECTRL